MLGEQESRRSRRSALFSINLHPMKAIAVGKHGSARGSWEQSRRFPDIPVILDNRLRHDRQRSSIDRAEMLDKLKGARNLLFNRTEHSRHVACAQAEQPGDYSGTGQNMSDPSNSDSNRLKPVDSLDVRDKSNV